MPARYAVDLADVTFGDLVDLVRQGLAWGVSNTAGIGVSYDERDHPETLSIERPSIGEQRRMIVADPLLLDELAEALDEVLEDEGDARGQVVQLAEARDLLRGQGS